MAKRLRRFTCQGCGSSELVTGGTSNFHCELCRQEKGMRDLHSPKYLAHRAVAKARKAGQLPDPRTLSCADCGAPAIEYDHRDYSKPLEVEPVCRACNLRRGPALNKEVGTKRASEADSTALEGTASTAA